MYHFRVKIIGRGKGGGGNAAAAMAYRGGGRSAASVIGYRAGLRLKDAITGRVYDYSAKGRIDENGFGVLHTEMMLPHGAPFWMSDPQLFADAIEMAEKRSDSQLFRELEISLPRELDLEQQRDLVRAFVATTCCAQGMAAHVSIHDERASDGGRNPHVHVLLATRRVGPDGFGKKETAWHRKTLVQEWRKAWADMANEALEAAGVERRIDHRSHKDRDIALEPDLYVGPKVNHDFDGVIADTRSAQRKEIKRRNLDAILDRPHLLLDAITREKATFTHRDIERQLTRATGLNVDDPEYPHVIAHVTASSGLVAVAADQKGVERFTTREMLDTELDMARAAHMLAKRKAGSLDRAVDVRPPPHLSEEQAKAYQHVVQGGDLTLVSGVAGAGKTTMLRAVVEALEAQGHRVRGAAIAGIAAQKLGEEAAISATTIAGMLADWARTDRTGMPASRAPLREGDVLIVDEAGMVDSRTMRRVLVEAERSRARVVLVGDARQLQAIGAGAAFRALADTHGAARLDTVHRQHEAWMRDATKAMGSGGVKEALNAYATAGMVHASASTSGAMADLIATWAKDRDVTRSQLILTYFTADVEEINANVRDVLRQRGELGPDVRVQVQKQVRDEDGNLVQRAAYRTFAQGDRILFLKNDYELDVRNGTPGQLEAVSDSGDFLVRLDDGRQVQFNAAQYGHVTLGYASTIHKAQGATVDRAYVLANNRFDASLTYVAMSRHREKATLFYGRDQFDRARTLEAVLSRKPVKDSTLDYLRVQRETERSDGGGGAARRLSSFRLQTPQPQLKPSPDFIARHGGEPSAPRAPKSALDIVRENAAKQATRARQSGRQRDIDE